MMNEMMKEMMMEMMMPMMQEAMKEMMAEMIKPMMANAVATDAPKATAPKAKYFLKAEKEVVMERDGLVCRPSYAGGKAPEGSGIWSREIASAIWYVNDKLIADKFGDSVEFKAPKKGAEPGYVAKTEKVAKELAKFTLRQGVTAEEWNAWVDMKVDSKMNEIERLEGLKVK